MEVEKLFLELLTSSVRGTQLNQGNLTLEREEWNRLLTLSAYHQIIPIVYESVCKMDSFRLRPPAVAGMWKRETVLAVARQARMTAEFLHLYKEICASGVKPLLMKGLICRNLYPKPDYRMSSDEDLLIPKEDFWKLDALLTERGFEKKETKEELSTNIDTLHEVGYRNLQTGLYLEIHLSLFPEESGAYGHFNRLFPGLHKEAVCLEIEKNAVWTLSYTEHFLFLLCHSVKHFLHSGFGIRQVLDMILFAEAYGDKIDWKRIVTVTKKHHMYIFLIHLFDIGVRYLGFDPEKACWPLEEKVLDGTLDSEELLEDLLSGGVFGSSTEERRHSSNITLAAASQKNTAGGIRASLFPGHAYMERKYSYVKKHPWLLPVGWCHRFLSFFIGKKSVGSRKVVETGNNRVKLLKKYGVISR